MPASRRTTLWDTRLSRSQLQAFLHSLIFSRGSIRTNMYELSVAYAITGPRTRRFDTFVQFGGGGLFFVPTESRSPYANQTRPAMVFGVGLNFKLAPRLAIRVEYRGLFYKNPDFAYYSGNAVPIS
jgi:opacity protein-like surface antigen